MLINFKKNIIERLNTIYLFMVMVISSVSYREFIVIVIVI